MMVRPMMSELKVQQAAAWQAQKVVDALRAAGWAFAAAVVWHHKTPDGLAGASYFDLPKALAGALPTLADSVRAFAREMDDAHRASGAPEWSSDAYSHTISGTTVDAKAARAALLETIRAEIIRRRAARASMGTMSERVDRAVDFELAELLEYLDEVKP